MCFEALAPSKKENPLLNAFKADTKYHQMMRDQGNTHPSECPIAQAQQQHAQMEHVTKEKPSMMLYATLHSANGTGISLVLKVEEGTLLQVDEHGLHFAGNAAPERRHEYPAQPLADLARAQTNAFRPSDYDGWKWPDPPAFNPAPEAIEAWAHADPKCTWSAEKASHFLWTETRRIQRERGE